MPYLFLFAFLFQGNKMLWKISNNVCPFTNLICVYKKPKCCIIRRIEKRKKKQNISQGSVFTKFNDYFFKLFKNAQRNYALISCKVAWTLRPIL